MNTLQGKKIVLGITGSIAAYKAAVLTRGLIKKGAEVQIVITPAGKEFITPITLSALTSKPVISEFFSQRDGTWHSHVDLGLWADAMVIAPATAATIGKMAHGVADNMLVTTYLSMKAPVFVAPAMDLDMFAHPSTQHNLDILRSYGNHIIEPASGELASHLVGKGRMEEPEKIIEVLEAFFARQQDLAGRKIVITAGPTYEKIDPVRFIGNYSSGKMGYALAEACASRGAEVVLVSGPCFTRSGSGIGERSGYPADGSSEHSAHRRGECGRNAPRSCRCLQGCRRRSLVCGRSGLHTGAGGRPENQTGKGRPGAAVETDL